MFPYRDAIETKTADGQYHYECEGIYPSDCTANLVEACIIDVANSEHREYFSTISCIEQKLPRFQTDSHNITKDDVMNVSSEFWKIHMPDIPFSQVENCVKVR